MFSSKLVKTNNLIFENIAGGDTEIKINCSSNSELIVNMPLTIQNNDFKVNGAKCLITSDYSYINSSKIFLASSILLDGSNYAKTLAAVAIISRVILLER